MIIQTKRRDQRTKVTPLTGCGERRTAIGSGSYLALISGLLLAFAHARPGECFQSVQPDFANVTANVSKSEVHVAEPFTLEMKITAPTGSNVRLPAVGEQLGEFDVIDHRDIVDIPSDVSPGQRSWSRRMTLESIVTGDLEIPAMEIQITSGTDTQAIQSEVIPVHVISVLEDRADPTRFRDIHSVVDASVPDPTSADWIWWTAGGVGLLLIGTTAVAVVAKRKPWLAPDVWALRKLAEIRESTAMQAGDSEAVTCEISAVLADFLQLQFEPAVQTKTTDELLHGLEIGAHLTRELAERFRQLCAEFDQVKFAGLRLTNVELDKLFENARELISATSSGIASGITTKSASDTFTDNPNPSDDTMRVI